MASVRLIWDKFNQKAWTIRSFEDHSNDSRHSGAEMRRVLGPFDLIVLGIGCIIGAGEWSNLGALSREA